VKLHTWNFEQKQAKGSKKYFLDITCRNLDVSKAKDRPKTKTKYINLSTIEEVKRFLEPADKPKASPKPQQPASRSPTPINSARNTQTPSKKSAKKEELVEKKQPLSARSKSMSRKNSAKKSAEKSEPANAPVPKSLRSAFKGRLAVSQVRARGCSGLQSARRSRSTS
jgi:hypothetical protein